MLISLILLTLITAGGFALTYLFVDDEPFMWRVAAGNVVGSALFGTILFVVASLFGLSAATVALSMIATLLPLLILAKDDERKLAWLDWQRAKGKLQGANLKKFVRFGYYVFFFALFWFFFDRAMFETKDGIFTGASHNLGDLPFHLGAIFGFTDGNNFPPQNPSFAGARFSYPFIADLVTAAFLKFGIDVKDAMFALNFSWAFSLLILLEKFVARFTSDRLAGKIAPALLFFSGGLGFLWFFSDYWSQTSGLWQFLWNLPKDYTMNDAFTWGNSLITLFITQRSLLLGMPMTLLVLGHLWRVFATENTEISEKETDKPVVDKNIIIKKLIPFLVGLLAGTLPLIHLHSLAVLFVVAVFFLILKPEKWYEWISFGVGVCVIAIPELLWSITGSASRTSEFIGWHFGWDVRDANIFWFWIKNTGILFPLLIAGIYLLFSYKRSEGNEIKKEASKAQVQRPKTKELLLFYLPFLFCFLISNIAKLAPWEWDNIKVLIYWYVGSIPFVALAISRFWSKGTALKVAAAACLAIMIFSGALDVWRTASGQIKMKVFDADAEQIAQLIKQKTPPNSLFLNAPTYNTAVVLSGRLSLMRFPGHLWSHGIDYGEREADVKRMYAGGYAMDGLLEKYGVDYVLMSPEERDTLKANDDFFKKYPVVAEAGQYRVYKIR